MGDSLALAGSSPRCWEVELFELLNAYNQSCRSGTALYKLGGSPPSGIYLPRVLWETASRRSFGWRSESNASGQSAAAPDPSPLTAAMPKAPTLTTSSILTSRKMDMPLDSCKAELSSSEELLEDGEVSRESSILSSPGAGRQTGRDAVALTWCCLSCCLPAPRQPPGLDASGCSLSARLPLLSADSPPSPASRLQLASSRRPLPVVDCTSLGIRLIPALSNNVTPLDCEHTLALALSHLPEITFHRAPYRTDRQTRSSFARSRRGGRSEAPRENNEWKEGIFAYSIPDGNRTPPHLAPPHTQPLS